MEFIGLGYHENSMFSRLQVIRESLYSCKLTCHNTACQVLWAKRLPCEDIVDKRVWPADFLTAGLRSTHKAPEINKQCKVM